MRVSYNTLIVKQNTSDYYKYTEKYAVKQTLLAGIWDFYKPIHSMDISLIFFNEWQKMANNLYLSFFSCLSIL